MGVLDIFKKSSNKRENKNNDFFENESENNKDIKNEDPIYVNIDNEDHIDIDFNNVDTLTGERCNELISHVLKDKDFGEEYIKTTNIRENIFVTVYMRNTLLKQFEGDNVKDLYDRLLKTIESFENMVFEKAMALDQLWKIINKATGCPVIDGQEEHILISDMYKEHMIEEYKKLGVEVEAVKINHEQFINELKDLYRTGYKGIRFTDGRQVPCTIKIEKMMEVSKVEKSKYPTNPELYFSLTAYLQEFRRTANNYSENKTLNVLGRVMMINLLKAKFIIPVQERGEKQFNLPIYKVGNDEKGTSIGLYVFTDEVEMRKLELTGLKLDSGWIAQVNEFKDIIDKVECCHISEVCINFSNMQFRLDRNTLDSIKKDAGIVSQEDQVRIKQEKFEEEELPKIFDKEVKVVNAPNGLPVFMREENRVCINNYIINTLVRKNMFDDAMNTFLEDNSVDVIKVFDVQTRNADIVIKEGSNNIGTFIMPMRYTDENINEDISDDSIYCSIDASKIKNINEEQQELKIAEREMNFYTIVNSGNQKTYLPLFNSPEEVRKIFPKNKFRLCKVTYEDIKEKLIPYDGVVIGPTTLSTMIPKELALKIYDINMYM